MVLPHLKNVDDLPDVVARALHDLFQSRPINLKALLESNFPTPFNNSFLGGLNKLQVETMINQGLKLLVHSVIADANDWCL